MQKFLRSINELERIKELHDKKIFLITGTNSFIKSGAGDLAGSLLAGPDVVHFKNVTPNPKFEEIKKAVDMYRKSNCNVILGIGGGSVIDMAKTTFILSAQEGSLEKIIKLNKIINKPEGLLIAAPTTAGSGAESTHFTVTYMNKQKYSLSHREALPDIVVLDPRLTYSLPPAVTAASGIDALSQAIEAYWSVESTDLSRRFSREALIKLLPNIKAAVLNPDPKVRQAMLEGANLAGQAINIAKTTACHAMSYGFTSYFGVPHGQAVAYSLPAFIEFNAAVTAKDCQDPRGVDFARERMDDLYEMLGVRDTASAKKQIENLIDSIGLHRHLDTSDANPAESIVKSIDPGRMSNNPRKVTPDDALLVINSIVG